MERINTTMAVSLLGKLIITVVTLGVIGGMTATIYLVVTDEASNYDEMTTAAPDPTTEDPGPDPPAPGPDTDLLYNVGIGIADMTGPCVEITFMGYAELSQSGAGIHLRQFSRAFIFEQNGSRVVLVTADVQSIGIAVRRQVVRNLQELYGNTYTLRNVILTATHTHATPGGYLVDFVLDVSILGFSRETFNAYVTGITNSIIAAHENMAPARLFLSTAVVPNAHMNRSPYSYDYNPPEELERYDSNTDDLLTQVRVVKEDGSLHGVLNWFAVHTTSMNMTNLLVSSDNLGYAAIKMEAMLNLKGSIVAGFFSSNLGDVSPNIRGARCEFSGDECDNQFLLCAAGERCYSLGPGDDMFESTRIIGTAVYEGAVEALNAAGEELRGDITVVHQFLDMPEQVVSKYDPLTRTFNESDTVAGCVAAMGYSFASGTIDGANTLNITQGTIEGNPLLDAIGGIIAESTEEDIECHAPKPILLPTGRANFPLPWHPSIVSATLIWLGGLAIAGVPGEPTTMAGRRMRDVVGDALERHGLERRVVVSGLTNEYIHYVATIEEYQVQRYEGASTIYGPNTLDIFLNKFSEFTDVALEGGTVPEGPEPADNVDRTISLILPVVVDNTPFGQSFGNVVEQPPAVARRGETVTATFIGANPRNNLRQGSSHVVVERQDLGEWVVVATDANWETKFHWERVSTLLGTSQATFEWTIPEGTLAAPHRFVYYGASRRRMSRKPITKKIINTAESCVDDNLRGVVATYPQLQLHPKHRVVTVRSTVDSKRVAVLGGGGSGHEPFAGGLVGSGMLDGAVAGGVFASPPTGHVLYGIAQLYKYNSGGVIVTIGNYTGDRLNFGKAIEKAKIAGLVGSGMLDGAVAGGVFASPPTGHVLYGIAQLYKYNSGGVIVIIGNYTGDRLNFGKAIEKAKIAEGLIVGEDVASSHNKTGGRSMCGEVFFYKLCGAMANKGYDLDTIRRIAAEANKSMATLGVCLSACSLPGQPPLFEIADDEMELGAGVHGEAGIKKMKMGTAKETVVMILEQVVAHLKLKSGDRVAVMIDNLGGTSFMEMNIISAETKSYLDCKKITVERIFSGHLKTSLEMHGFQICLLHLNKEHGDLWLELLDAPTAAVGWTGGEASVRREGGHIDDDTLLQSDARKCIILIHEYYQSAYNMKQAAAGPALSPKHQELFRVSLAKAAEDLVRSEKLLNRLDSGCGDGDCGITLKKFGLAILSYLSAASVQNPSDVLWDLSEIAETDMGGTSGGIYSLGLSAASQAFTKAKTVDASSWLQAWEAAMRAITKYGGAEPGDRTMLDTLYTAAAAFKQHLGKDLKHALVQTDKAADKGAKATANMVARAGRASYVASGYTQDEDAGARAAAVWLHAILTSIADTL
ncbi:hypothetical protein MSG28_006555 [Choristoneura fumiferana]|uniref:Uncharacterized protein n=1 Tax=Choristoneura fumiferana TaxID=7141 RepID=A0ACC0JF95_CHOFU|nr:hypothetical protein MSG28_006555 [Choristoneura fumiferana]